MPVFFFLPLICSLCQDVLFAQIFPCCGVLVYTSSKELGPHDCVRSGRLWLNIFCCWDGRLGVWESCQFSAVLSVDSVVVSYSNEEPCH